MLIPLSKGQFAIIDDEDASLVGDGSWHAGWNKTSKTYYAKQSYKDQQGKYRVRLMHRIIVGVTDPKIDVDHKNHNGLDNQRHNLRIATRSQNTANSRIRCGSSQYRGVSLTRKRGAWRAKIGTNGHETCLGHYATEVEAAQAYNNEAIIRFGEFASLNDVPDGKPEKIVLYNPATNGTSYNKQCKKWVGYVRVNGKHKHLGLFVTQEEALEAISKFKQENADGNNSAAVDKPADWCASSSPELV